jgi:hypothetical protein
LNGLPEPGAKHGEARSERLVIFRLTIFTLFVMKLRRVVYAVEDDEVEDYGIKS